MDLTLSDLALATGWVVAMWLMTSATLVGIGLYGLRLFGLRELDGERVVMAFWLGLCVTIALLQLWHLFFAVSYWTLGLLCGLGATGVAREWGALRRCWTGALRKHWLGMGFATLAFLWLAAIATGPCLFGDTGMYHLPMARWLVSYPIVPGLANLHGRFGFNNSSLLFAALFEVGGLAGRSHHLANGPLVVMFWTGAALSARRWLASGPFVAARHSSALFYLFLLVPAVQLALGPYFTSLATDIPAALLLMVGAWRLCHVLSAASEPEDAEDAARSFDIVFITTVLTTAITVKITSLPFAVLGLLLLAWRVLGRKRAEQSPRGVAVLALPAVVAASLLLPWCVRGVVLSGYPAYPAAILPVPVEWRVPAEQARAEHAWALASSRYDRKLKPDGWVAAWFRHRVKGPLISWPLVVTGMGMALYLSFVLRRRPRGSKSAPTLGPLVAISLLSCGAWFILGPNPRFGFAFLWILAASCAVLCGQAFSSTLQKPAFRIALLACCLLAAVLSTLDLTTDVKLDWRRRWLAIEPGADAGMHPYKKIEMITVESDHGLRMYVPVRTNGAWQSPLPATPYPAANLRLRRKGDLSGGFVSEGEWKPARWPKADSDFLARWRRHEFEAASDRRSRQAPESPGSQPPAL